MQTMALHLRPLFVWALSFVLSAWPSRTARSGG